MLLSSSKGISYLPGIIDFYFLFFVNLSYKIISFPVLILHFFLYSNVHEA